MNSFKKCTGLAALLSAAFAGSANAAEVLVTSDITTSTTWTANNTYNLQEQIYVRNGATLTIEAGTVIASTTGLGGSLAVVRDSQIFVNGTAANPVIMTSTADVATWTNGDPKTGLWRESANEWGNLTIMGRAYVSENVAPPGQTNVATPNANNEGVMEGLTPPGGGAPANSIYYGGGDDDDDSGSISYLSLRYGGKVIALANELNGLSLGGIGRGTDLNFIEVMNNVDDGIEIWGGTCNLKNFSIWNVGDDSFDVDQGWRGKAQFGLIVQGFSADASQGSGVGDNCFETDGAELSSYQPVTTATIYNCTVVGQPEDGDHATAWRDNARVQYRNCVFMDVGAEVVRNDGDGGEGLGGYGAAGTLSFDDTWTTDYNVFSTVNAPANPAAFYTTQTSGKLAEIKDSVFFRNGSGSAYTTANTVGVFDAGNNNVQVASVLDADAPIKALTRGPLVVRGGKDMLPVLSIDPRANNEATTSVAAAPNDGFFTPASFRGAFDATTNWLAGWSAADAFCFFDAPASVATREGVNNVPMSLSTNGLPTVGNASFAFVADNPTSACGVGPGSIALVFISLQDQFNFALPQYGCTGGTSTLLINPVFFGAPITGLYTGAPSVLPSPLPANSGLCGVDFSAQVAFFAGPGVIRAGSAVDCVIGK